MTTNTFFFVHHTGAVYRKDMDIAISSVSVGKLEEWQLVAQSNLVVVMYPSGTGKILKDREYNREDLSRDEMVMLALQAEPI